MKIDTQDSSPKMMMKSPSSSSQGKKVESIKVTTLEVRRQSLEDFLFYRTKKMSNKKKMKKKRHDVEIDELLNRENNAHNHHRLISR